MSTCIQCGMIDTRAKDGICSLCRPELQPPVPGPAYRSPGILTQEWLELFSGLLTTTSPLRPMMRITLRCGPPDGVDPENEEVLRIIHHCALTNPELKVHRDWVNIARDRGLRWAATNELCGAEDYDDSVFDVEQ